MQAYLHDKERRTCLCLQIKLNTHWNILCRFRRSPLFLYILCIMIPIFPYACLHKNLNKDIIWQSLLGAIFDNKTLKFILLLPATLIVCSIKRLKGLLFYYTILLYYKWLFQSQFSGLCVFTACTFLYSCGFKG